MPEVLSGSMDGQSVSVLIQTMADLLGSNVGSSRFQNIVKGWIRSTLQEIQLKDPKSRRTMVVDAPFTLIADTDTYDVRDTEDDGGFGWTNCFEVVNLRIPDISDRQLEVIGITQHRNRADALSVSGPAYSVVMLDQFRVKFVPSPDQAYTGYGDYYQDIPNLTELAHKVDWPRAWDNALEEGVKFRGLQWQYTQQPSVWIPARNVFMASLEQLRMVEKTDTRRSRKAIITRALRSKRRIPNDRSADVRYRGW